METDWQNGQLKDESWEVLQKAAVDFTVSSEEVTDTGYTPTWVEYSQKPGIQISTGFAKLKTGNYWLGFSIIDHPLRSTLQNSKWLYFFLAFGCFLVGVMIISSYFRALDQQYETELRRRRMSDTMAHEMKTPLGIIKNYSEVLTEETDREKCRQYLEAISQEVDSMNDMIIRLLELSKMEAGTYPLKLGVTSVSRIAQKVLDRGEILLLPKDLQVKAEIQDNVTLLADEKLLRESIINLMLNAIHYSDRSSIIRLSVQKEKGGVRIAVENQGNPVAPQDGARIWESFYRGEMAREREVSGNGLGLAIVASTCTLHRGRCGFENREYGVELWMYIPDQENRPKEKRLPVGPLIQEERRGLSLSGLTGSFGLQVSGNAFLALASMGAVFNVCLWYDLYRRYHLKELP